MRKNSWMLLFLIAGVISTMRFVLPPLPHYQPPPSINTPGQVIPVAGSGNSDPSFIRNSGLVIDKSITATSEVPDRLRQYLTVPVSKLFGGKVVREPSEGQRFLAKRGHGPHWGLDLVLARDQTRGAQVYNPYPPGRVIQITRLNTSQPGRTEVVLCHEISVPPYEKKFRVLTKWIHMLTQRQVAGRPPQPGEVDQMTVESYPKVNGEIVVPTGGLVGYVGNNGNSYSGGRLVQWDAKRGIFVGGADHLHFGLYLETIAGGRASPKDPYTFLTGFGRGGKPNSTFQALNSQSNQSESSNQEDLDSIGSLDD